MAQIYLIEDDEGTAQEITLELVRAGFQVRHFGAGAPALEAIRLSPPDVLVLDRQLPDGEGLDILAELRRDGIKTPVLVLSALGGLNDRVRGLRSGGDDYLPKPFALIELLARVEALLRRPDDTRETRLFAGPIDIDILAGTAMRGGRDLALGRREMALLEYLVRRKGQVVTRSMLLRDVWGYNFEPRSNVVDVHMSLLRRKVDTEDDIPLIRNIRGQGYRFDARA